MWALQRSPSAPRCSPRPAIPGIAEVALCFPIDPADPAAGRAARRRPRRRPRRRRPRGAAGRGRRRRRARPAGRHCFGPGAAGARLEGSKAWMKEVLADAGVPTAAPRQPSASTTKPPRSRSSRRSAPPYVVKTDGLAAGKGVVVTESLAEARDAVRAYLSGEAFGDAGRTLVIEEGLAGPGALAARRVQRRPRRGAAARARAGLQARRSTATPARTPAAWARTHRCRSSTDADRRPGDGPRGTPHAARGSPTTTPTTAACSTPG